MPPKRRYTGWLLLVSLLLVALYLGSLSREVVGPGESRVAQLAWEMHQYGNWLLPTYNDEVKPTTLTKPPLYHWLVVAVATPLGWEDYALRLVSVAALLASVWLSWWLGRRLFKDPEPAFWGALVLASALVFVVYGQSARMDLFFSFLVLLAMALLYRMVEDPAEKAPKVGFFVVIGLAMLVKGPAGFIIPGSTALFMTLGRGRSATLGQLLPPWGWLLFLVIGLSWYLAVALLAPPEAVKSLFIGEPLNWAEGNADGIQTRIWYYLPLLLGGLFPWSLFLAAALVAAMGSGHRQERPVRFLLFWFLGGLLLFSLGGKKAIRYLLPILPAAALLVGWYFHRLKVRGRIGWGGRLAGALVSLLSALLVLGLLWGLADPDAAGRWLLEGRNPTDRVVLGILWNTMADHRALTAAVALVLLGLSSFALHRLHRARIEAAVVSYALVSWMVLASYFYGLLPVQSALLSPRAAAQFIAREVGDAPLLGGGRAFQRAMHWYLRRSFEPLPARQLRERIATDPSQAAFFMHYRPLPAELEARPHCQWINPKYRISFFPVAGTELACP